MGRGRKTGDLLNGWLVLDKPEGLSSTQALSRARALLNARKAGHAGTLDPLATGILPLAFGEATKTVPFCQNASKTYEFTVRWGAATNTDDREGEITQTSDTRPGEKEIRDLLPLFTGTISQTPPQYSAIKIDGERAYAMARKGEDVDIAARPVTVYDLRITGHSATETAAETTFECHCGKGTYVRALARDMGEKLGCFGHIVKLRRIAVGNFTQENAISLDELEKMVQSAPANEFLLPVEAPLDDIPAIYLTDNEAGRLRNGQSVLLFSRDGQNRLQAAGLDPLTADSTVLARTSRKPVALVSVKGVEVSPIRVLNV